MMHNGTSRAAGADGSESPVAPSGPGFTPFPEGFVWGSASSSYQVEGAASDGGRAPSIWDDFCRKQGAVYAGHTGDVACDHYHRFPEDVGIMSRMGLHAYRLSIAWPRVMPLGVGRANADGLAFYDRLIDALLSAGIDPWVTLYHWDLPLALHERGGWLNRDIAEWAGEYAACVVDKLSDRVTRWMTINEPQIFIGLGYCDGTHAPGLKLSLAGQAQAAHNALRAHGRMAQAIRSGAKRPPKVGWAPVGRTCIPATETPADIEAARAEMFAMRTTSLFTNTWFADPAVFGRYPDDGLRLFGTSGPKIEPGDMELIKQPLDYYGVNIYSGDRYRAGAGGPELVAYPPGHPQTMIRWWFAPEALRWGPRFLHERYKLPIVITENGLSSMDWVCEDGRVHDTLRIDLTARFLRQLRRAIDDGTPVGGYFHWSILDNFEWGEGYKERFGLVHVDYATLKRTPKDSAEWFARVIKLNGVPGAGEAYPVHEVAPPAAAPGGVQTVARAGAKS